VSYWLGVLFFVVALLSSVMIHEAGHFLTARAFGMKATQFFVGFGPTLFSRRRGETEYGVKAILAGGFVKIVGMTPFEEVATADEPRAFFRKPLRERVVVLAAGSATHFVIALVLLAGVSFLTPQPLPGAKVRQVSSCLSIADPQARPEPGPGGACPAGSVPAPAAGVLQRGDVILGIGGRRFTSDDGPGAVTQALRTAPDPRVTLLVRRAGREISVPVTLARVQRDRDTGDPGKDSVLALGVLPGEVGFASPSASQGWSAFRRILGTGPQSLLGGTAAAVQKIPDRFGHLFSSNSADGPQSVVGIAQISGSIGSAADIPLGVKIGSLVGIVASVNFFVGVLNLLPLLPFDGGHIAVNVVDRLRNLLRARRQRQAGTITEVYSRFAPVSYAFFAVIAVGSLLVLTSNVVNPLRL